MDMDQGYPATKEGTDAYRQFEVYISAILSPFPCAWLTETLVLGKYPPWTGNCKLSNNPLVNWFSQLACSVCVQVAPTVVRLSTLPQKYAKALSRVRQAQTNTI